MSIGIMFIAAVGGFAGILSTGYLVVSMPAVIIWKLYRCAKFGYTMFQ